MKTQLHESMNRRYAYVKTHSALITATLLDPRFKSRYLISFEIDIATKEIVNFLKSRETNVGEVKSVNNSSEKPSYPSTSISQSAKEEGLWDVHDKSIYQTETAALDDQLSIVKKTVQFYRSQDRKANIYAYWNSSSYLFLRKAVLKYLSAPPTSVSSE